LLQNPGRAAIVAVFTQSISSRRMVAGGRR
jgi:hypothetical protein